MIKDRLTLVSGSVVFRQKKRTKPRWFIVKDQEDSAWQLPLTLARKGESSVRAAIRHMAEEGGMRAKVLEEAGRRGGAGKVDGKTVSQRFLYYLMVYRGGGEEALEFVETAWLPYSKARARLKSKRDKAMLSAAKKTLKQLQKERGKKILSRSQPE
jgi:8-oxo-dGTP pyrophosphatase MutT (NUDIX family)